MPVNSTAVNNLYEFGPFRLDPQKRVLLRNGEPVPLTPKTFETLLALVQNAGQPLSRETLMKMVWPDSFVEEGNLTQNISVLRKTLGSGNRYIVTIPGHGYQFAERVTETEAEEEKQEEAQIEEGEPPAEVADTANRQRRRLTGSFAVFGLVALAALAAMLLFRGPSLRTGIGTTLAPAVSASAPSRRSLAVIGFRNASGRAEDEWISTAFSEMLNTELAAGNQVRLVSEEDVARARVESPLPDVGSLSKDSLRQLRAELGTDLVVLGSYTALRQRDGERIRFDLRVQDTRTGETLVEKSATGNGKELFQLVGEIGAQLRQQLGIAQLSGEEDAQLRANVDANPLATRLYAQGLDKLRRFDALGARDLLQKAVAADPGRALFHAALAQCWSALGYDGNARAEAKKAFELSGNFARREQLVAEGRYRELSRNLPAALEIYRTLWNFFPDDLEYGLRLATVQTESGQGKDALASVARMRHLPEPQNNDPRIAIVEAKAAESLSDFAHELKASSAAVAAAQARGSRLIEARALRQQGYAYQRLGRPVEAIASFEQAGRLWTAAGDRFGAASAQHMIALAQYNRGDFQAASQSFQDALAVFRQVGAQEAIASCSHNYAMLLHDQGRLPQAHRALEEALRIQRELHDERGVAADLDDLGNVQLSMGDLPAAVHSKELAIEGFQHTGNRFGEAITLSNLGEVLFAQGRLPAAKERFDQSLALKEQIGYKRGIGFCWMDLAAVLRAQDRLPEARAMTLKALSLHRQLGDEFTAAESTLQLAEIALDQGRSGEAEALARNAAAVFEHHKAADHGAFSYAVLSRALLAQARLKEAQVASNSAMTLAQKGGDREGRFQALLAAAAVRAASGRAGEAAQLLRALQAEASRYGYVPYELEARLRLAELELKMGRRGARERLAHVQTEAREKGFLRLASQAGAALQGKASTA